MKLKREVINKMIENKCSKKEIDFILLIAQWQQENGVIYNVHFSNVIKELDIHQKTFYDLLDRLEKKNIISYEKCRVGYYHITILDNDFSDGIYKDISYININRPFLFGQQFRSFKASVKLVILTIIINGLHKNKVIERKYSKKSLAKYANISHFNQELISEIIECITDLVEQDRVVFAIAKVKQSVYAIKLVFTYKRREYEKSFLQRHMYASFLNKWRIPYTLTDINNLVQMDNQYKDIHSVYSIHLSKLFVQYRRKCKLDQNVSVVCKVIRTIMKQKSKGRGIQLILHSMKYLPLI